MAQAAWTHSVETRHYNDRTITVEIHLPALNVAGWNCLTWSVDLILPPSASMATTGHTASSFTGLAASAVARFDVTFPVVRNNEVRNSRAWLRVKVRNPSDSAGVVLHRQSGSPL